MGAGSRDIGGDKECKGMTEENKQQICDISSGLGGVKSVTNKVTTTMNKVFGEFNDLEKELEDMAKEKRERLCVCVTCCHRF